MKCQFVHIFSQNPCKVRAGFCATGMKGKTKRLTERRARSQRLFIKGGRLSIWDNPKCWKLPHPEPKHLFSPSLPLSFSVSLCCSFTIKCKWVNSGCNLQNASNVLHYFYLLSAFCPFFVSLQSLTFLVACGSSLTARMLHAKKLYNLLV